MNRHFKRVKRAFNKGILTALFVFAGLISPFAFVTAPLSDATVNGIYGTAALVAFVGFVVQTVWDMFQK